MNSELIIIKEYCVQSRIDPSFIRQLAEEGLIDIYIADDEYIYMSQLKRLESYARLHYDLSVNIEGIDIIQNLWDRMDEMQREIKRLREIVHLFE